MPLDGKLARRDKMREPEGWGTRSAGFLMLARLCYGVKGGEKLP